MKLHLLHVKNGFTAIIEHVKRKTLIDINKLSESDRQEEGALLESFEKSSAAGYVHKATNPISYWQNKFGTDSAFRTIITHPDKDHIRGFNEFVDTVGTTNLWMPTKHINTIPEDVDGDRIKMIVEGKESGVTFIEPTRGSDTSFFGTGDADWDQIEILHPTDTYQSETTNQGSYLIKINHGKSSILVGGDTEQETFKWLLEYHPDELKCTVFIASHHGRQSGWPGKDVMEHMNPLMVLIPKGKIASKDSAINNYARVLGNDRYLTTSYAGNIRITVNKDDDISILECERDYVNKNLSDMLESARILREKDV